MAFTLQLPGCTGAVVNYGDLIQSIKQAQPFATSLAGTGVTETLAARSIISGFYLRSGATAAVAVTTDTAANIITALGGTANSYIGQSSLLYYTNNNSAAGAVTFTGGTGVTVSTLATVPIYNTAIITVTVTSATTVAFSIVGYTAPALPVTNYVTVSANGATAAAGELLGAAMSTLNLSANSANAFTTRTGAQMAGDIPNIQIGQTWRQRILANGNNTVTLTAGASGVTITGTATATTGTYRDYVVTYTAASTFVFQNIGGGSV